jgi:putative redox protein
MTINNGWTEIQTDWLGSMAFLGTNHEGATVQIGSLEGEPALRPMQLMLASLAGCTGMDIISILKKKRLEPVKFQIQVRGKRAEDHPRIYTEIEVQYQLWGNNLDAKSVEQAIQLSEEKYCSARAMLAAVARITSTYQIFEEAWLPVQVNH